MTAVYPALNAISTASSVSVKEPIWSEYVCSENNQHVQIGSENYVLGADGLLMPTRKNQAPPDLRHFQ